MGECVSLLTLPLAKQHILSGGPGGATLLTWMITNCSRDTFLVRGPAYLPTYLPWLRTSSGFFLLAAQSDSTPYPYTLLGRRDATLGKKLPASLKSHSFKINIKALRHGMKAEKGRFARDASLGDFFLYCSSLLPTEQCVSRPVAAFHDY